MPRFYKEILPVIAILVASNGSVAQSSGPTPPSNYAPETTPSSVNAPNLTSLTSQNSGMLQPDVITGTRRTLSPNMEVAQTGQNKFRASLSLQPDHYMDAAGTWQPISPRFTQVGTGQSAQYSGDGALVQARLPVTHGAGANMVKGVAYSNQVVTTTLSKNGGVDGAHFVTTTVNAGTKPVTVTGDAQWTPTRMVVDGATVMQAGAGSASAAVSALNGSVITYPNAYGDVAERMTLVANGMQDDIIIPSAASLPQGYAASDSALGFETVVTLSPGLAFYIDGIRQTVDFTATGALEVRDESGSPLFLLPPVTASDASGAMTATVRGRYIGHFGGNDFYLTAAIPLGWLTAPERLYPVTVGSIYYSIWPSSADVVLSGFTPTSNWGTYQGNYAGDRLTSLVRWDAISLPAHAMVDSAYALMYMTATSGYASDVVNVSSVALPWDEYAATWTNRVTSVPWTNPGGDADALLSSLAINTSLQVYSWPVTDAVAQWVSTHKANYGLLFWGPTYGYSTNWYKIFTSREDSPFAFRPELDINYTQGPVNLSPYVTNNRGVPSPDWYAINRGSKWDAIAARPSAGADYDVSLWSTGAYTGFLTGSSYGGNTVDYVMINGNYAPASSAYPKVMQWNGTGTYAIEQATNTADINGFHTYGPYTMPANDVVRVWNAVLTSGTKAYFRVRPVSGDANLSMALHWTNPANLSTVYQGKGQAVAFSNGGGAGKPAYLAYTPSTTDNYGLVVINNGASIGASYYIDVATTPFPRSYLPSVMKHYTPPCDAYDPNETDLTRYGPLLSGVNYQAKLCQNDIDKYYLVTHSTGTLQVSITVPPTLLINALNGISIAVYNPAGNDTTLTGCNTPAPSGGAYYSPLTQITTVFSCPNLPAGQYRVNVYSTNNLVYYDNVNYYTLNITYP